MKKVAAFIILAFLSFTTISAAEAPPASLHLELGKDTLALAEPTYLTATITNNMNQDLLLDNFLLFRLKQEPFRFSLFLITPGGKEWAYVGTRGSISISFAPTVRHHLLVPSGQSASKGMMLWWTTFAPRKYQSALEKLPSGTYKLFAIYELPDQENLHKVVIYSDTVEFLFLPVRWEHMQAIIEMDSLRRYFTGGDASWRVLPRLQRIGDSKTPYSEAAHALFYGWTNSFDSLTRGKAHFDELYPQSQFQLKFLKRQFLYAKKEGRTDVLDSLNRLLLKIEPSNTDALLRQGVIKHPATLEDVK
ncbi:MAG: hypothetical protein E3J71_05635 [Candidatus Stahlbacteria bacterium]|nr:MAG: hypothetical protein E3J71_05635 [Candidatus Stahlbacteria bacterium]